MSYAVQTEKLLDQICDIGLYKEKHCDLLLFLSCLEKQRALIWSLHVRTNFIIFFYGTHKNCFTF